MRSRELLLMRIVWIQALLATVGSLYFSEVMLLPPCKLCWYQRAMMYPLVWIFGVGVYKKDKRAWRYGLPLAGVGALIAFYHNLLYYKVIPESLQPCVTGVSCTTKLIEWAGFITIPLLSLAGFGVILVAGWLATRNPAKRG